MAEIPKPPVNTSCRIFEDDSVVFINREAENTLFNTLMKDITDIRDQGAQEIGKRYKTLKSTIYQRFADFIQKTPTTAAAPAAAAQPAAAAAVPMTPSEARAAEAKELVAAGRKLKELEINKNTEKNSEKLAKINAEITLLKTKYNVSNKYLKYKQKYLISKNMDPNTVSLNDLVGLTQSEINAKYLKYKQKYLMSK